MSNADLTTRLAALQGAIDEAPLVTNDDYPDQLDGIDDGDYQAKIWGWEVNDDYANHPGVVSLKTIVDLQGGEHGGKRLEIFHWDILSPKQLPYLKTHFYNLGVDQLDLTQVQNGSKLFEELNDTLVLIGVYTGKTVNQRTGKPFRNVVVRKRLDGSDLGTGAEQIAGFEGGDLQSEPVGEDEIPF